MVVHHQRGELPLARLGGLDSSRRARRAHHDVEHATLLLLNHIELVGDVANGARRRDRLGGQNHLEQTRHE